MSIEKALEILKYDVRLIEYHLNNGMLTKAELEKHINGIPDSSDLIAIAAEPEPESDLDSEDDLDVDDVDDSDVTNDNLDVAEDTSSDDGSGTPQAH